MPPQPIAIQLVTAAGCATCLQAQQAIADTIAGLADEYPIALSQLNLVDHPELLSQYDIWGTPALIVNDELAFVGAVDAQQLREKLADVTAGR